MEEETEVGMGVGGGGLKQQREEKEAEVGVEWVQEKETEVGMAVGAGEGNRGMSEGFCSAMLSARHGVAACVVIDDTLSVPLATRP